MTRLRTAAPGKVNLCLFVGAPRADGYHPLVSVFQAVDLADVVTLEPAPGGADEVVCPGIEGPNLAATALARYRERTGYAGPPVRVTIDKRVPVAAGMGGGSGDAAAALRLIHAAATGGPAGRSAPGAAAAAGSASGGAGTDPGVLAQLAPQLGADVPFALHGGRALVTGIGERVQPLPAGPPAALVVVPSSEALATPAVYRQADALPSVRTPDALAAAAADVRARLARGATPPAVNDLQPAARALCPGIDAALEALAAAGGADPLVSGSGPTTFARFHDVAAAERAAASLRGRFPGTVVARPARTGLTAVVEVPA